MWERFSLKMDKIIHFIIAKKAKSGNTYSNIKVQKILLEKAQDLDFAYERYAIYRKASENREKGQNFGEI